MQKWKKEIINWLKGVKTCNKFPKSGQKWTKKLKFCNNKKGIKWVNKVQKMSNNGPKRRQKLAKIL